MRYIAGKVPRTSLAVLVLFLITVLIGVVTVIPASAGTLAWSVIDTPSNNGNLLLPGSDLDFLLIASDGATMFTYDNTNRLLYKSTDAGLSWTTTGVGDGLEANVVAAMAISPNYPDDGTLVAATVNKVFFSDNGGRTFNEVPNNVGGLIAVGSSITSIDIATWYRGGIAILVGDSNGAQGGGVSLFKAIDLTWTDLFVGDWDGGGVDNPCDALAVAFSPNHEIDSAMIAVVTYDPGTAVINTKTTTKLVDHNWSADLPNGTIFTLEAAGAVIAFPDDYDWDWANRMLIGTSGTTDDDAFRFTGNTISLAVDVDDLDVEGTGTPTHVKSIAYRGTGFASCDVLIGKVDSGDIRHSTYINLNPITWVSSTESLPGSTNINVLWSPTDDTLYAVSSGAGSALSRSLDGGYSWNQIALIDVSAMINLSFLDFAVIDTETFYVLMLDDADGPNGFTPGDYTVLFRTTNGALNWEQIAFYRTLTGEAMNILEPSPDYATDNTLFIAQNNEILWKTTNGGNTFTKTSAPRDITSLAAVNSATYYTGHVDAFYKSGRTEAAALGGDAAVSIEVASDGTVFVGTDNGLVLVSTDDGKTFRSLGEAEILGASANIIVALDVDYATNKIIYAGSSDGGKGIQTWTLNSSAAWKQLDDDNNTLSCTGLATTDYGAFYAASNAVDRGVRRSVSRTNQKLFTNFESMTESLPAGAKVEGLAVFPESNLLYAIVNGVAPGAFGYPYRLLVFEDVMALLPQLSEPLDKAIISGDVILHWQQIDSPVAVRYRYQVTNDAAFTDKVLEDVIGGTMANLAGLAPGSQYWWRVFVDAGQPLRSKESAIWSFTVEVPSPVLSTTAPGFNNVGMRPMFVWQPVNSATGYQFELADNPEFKNATVQNDLTHTTWAWDEDLEYSTSYFWRVRAIKSNGSSQTVGKWAEAAFVTISAPVQAVQRVEIKEQPEVKPEEITLPAPQVELPPQAPAGQIAPLYIWIIVGLSLVLMIAIILLIMSTRRIRPF